MHRILTIVGKTIGRGNYELERGLCKGKSSTQGGYALGYEDRGAMHWAKGGEHVKGDRTLESGLRTARGTDL